MELLDALNWRYAVKKFDVERKVAPETVEKLIEAARLTPTSIGLMPFRLLVIEDRELLTSLGRHCWGQMQPETCSHLFVLASLKTVDIPFADKVMDRVIEERDLGEKGEGLRQMVHGYINNMTDEQVVAWVDKQVYIALGQLMTAAAIEGVDTCPMEGFVPTKIDEALGLAEKDLRSVLLLPIGYRAKDDHHQNYKKIRPEKDEFLVG